MVRADKNNVVISKTFLGKHVVSYHCSHCLEKLRSNLRNAGQLEFCPACQVQIRVPGFREKENLENELDLPRPRQIEVAKLKSKAQLDILESQMVKKVEASKVNQRLSLIQFDTEMESKYLEKYLRINSGENDRKLRVLVQLGQNFKSKLSEVENENWPENLEQSAVRQLKSIYLSLIHI